MQLRSARLCLDCEEVHDANVCPACASETFAFMTRWIPAPERRMTPRPAEPAPQAEMYRQLLAPDRASPATSRWLKRGVFGLAAVSAAAWALKRKPAGDGDASGRPPKDPPESTLR